jgi:hypothetical protein
VESNPEVSYSDDKDARWVVKGKKSEYVYKLHMALDDQKGFTLGVI